MTPSLTLGIDVGGTSIKAATVDGAGGAHAQRRIATPADDASGEKTAAIVAELVDEFSRDHRLASVGLVVPGIVDEASGVVVNAVNLGWRNVPLRAMVSRNIPLPLAFGQDVRAGAYAEAAEGAARGRGVCVFVPIGTGIAAGIIVNGCPLSSGGWAGEIGQIEVTSTPERARSHSQKLESLASASAIARRIGCVDAKAAAELVRGGDEHAVRVWHDAVDAIAEALAWTTSVVGAEVIIIGGGLAEAGPVLLDPLVRALGSRLGVLRRPEVVTATFGDQAAIIGAGLLAHQLDAHQLETYQLEAHRP